MLGRKGSEDALKNLIRSRNLGGKKTGGGGGGGSRKKGLVVGPRNYGGLPRKWVRKGYAGRGCVKESGKKGQQKNAEAARGRKRKGG